jgi:monoamine oxidase
LFTPISGSFPDSRLSVFSLDACPMPRIPRTTLLRRLISRLRERDEFVDAPSSPGRREFIRNAALAGAGVALAGCAGNPDASARPSAAKGPVAIVGAGAAGLTAAWRLQRAGFEVHLYEASHRFGGRMWTKKGFNAEGMFCELGGELVDTGHKPLIALADELGVGVRAIRAPDATGGERYFIDGRLYSEAEVVTAFVSLAPRIANDAAGLLDDKDAWTDKARAFDATKLCDYLREAGRDTNTPAWLIRALDVAYVTEYGVPTCRQSAMNLLGMISPDASSGFKVYGESDEAFRIAGGSSSLTDELARRLDGRAEIFKGHRLASIADTGEKIALTFDVGIKAGAKTAKYSRVILALPFPLLREVVGWDSLALSDSKKKAVRELGWGENTKVMFGMHPGFMDTLRSASGGAGAFSDALFECWETSRGQPGRSGIITCYFGGAAARGFVTTGPDHFLDELDRVFPGAKAAHDGNKIQMDWPRFTFAKGSFSATLVGQYCGMVAESASPELSGRLVFAGEHTSENSCGFMNGAVESGERAAKEILG